MKGRVRENRARGERGGGCRQLGRWVGWRRKLGRVVETWGFGGSMIPVGAAARIVIDGAS